MTTEPVAALSARAPASKVERARLILERAIEWIAMPKLRGILTARRALQDCEHGDYARALPVLARLVEDPAVAPSVLAVAHIHRGFCLLSLGDANDALAAVRRAIPGDIPTQNLPLAFAVVASASRDIGDYAGMLGAAQAAVALGQTADRLFLVAVAKKNRGDVDGAILALDRAIDLDPKDALVEMTRGGYGMIKGEPGARERALRAIEDTSLTRPDDLTWHMNLAWFAALGDDADALARIIDECRRHAVNTMDRQRLARYLRIEVDFERYREHPAFAAAVAAITSSAA